MGILKDLIGFSLVCLSFFNPFNLNLPLRLSLFLIGFDLMSFLPKVAIFLFDFFIGFSGLGILLLFLLFVDILAKIILSGLAVIVKPLLIFLLLYYVNPNLAISFAASAVNFLINLASLLK